MSGTNDFSYLNVLSKPLDDHQEKVCFSNRNTVVAAGAGSGKTEVLAKRFAWLIISCGIKVQEILTLTFTNKAAAEMYQRIHRTLRTLADSPDVSEEVKQKAKQALMDFSLAHIQTLDSYNVFRKDEVRESFDRELLMQNAPSSNGVAYQIPPVIE